MGCAEAQACVADRCVDNCVQTDSFQVGSEEQWAAHQVRSEGQVLLTPCHLDELELTCGEGPLRTLYSGPSITGSSLRLQMKVDPSRPIVMFGVVAGAAHVNYQSPAEWTDELAFQLSVGDHSLEFLPFSFCEEIYGRIELASVAEAGAEQVEVEFRAADQGRNCVALSSIKAYSCHWSPL